MSTNFNPVKADSPVTVKTKFKQWAELGSATSTLHLGILLLVVWLGLTTISYAVGQNEPSPSEVAPGELQLGKLQVVELFTSHGCSSCPAAEKLLGELLNEHDDLLALEYHVDYWNTLVHGSDGNFVDPFSRPEHSLRQRQYNAAHLSGRPGVYTPQAVINGVTAAVGSNGKQVRKALANIPESMFKIDVASTDSTDSASVLSVNVLGDAGQLAALEGTDIMLVSYMDKATTSITGGENRHRELVNHHVVTKVARMGEISPTGNMMFFVDRPAAGMGCIVLVQEGASTPIYAAAECL